MSIGSIYKVSPDEISLVFSLHPRENFIQVTELQQPPRPKEPWFDSLLKKARPILFGLDRAPSPVFANQRELGVYGERVAEAYLRRQGYKPLVRNFKTQWGEIDLTCRDGEVLVFVEVKSRTRGGPDRPATAVNASKRRHMLRSAVEYIHLLRDRDPRTRFDIVEVILETGKMPDCVLIRGIMELEGKTL